MIKYFIRSLLIFPAECHWSVALLYQLDIKKISFNAELIAKSLPQ